MFSTNSNASPAPTTFQTYLTRAIPFRRRRQSSVSTGAGSWQRNNSDGSSVAAGSPLTPTTQFSPLDGASLSALAGHQRQDSAGYDFQTSTSPWHSRQNSAIEPSGPPPRRLSSQTELPNSSVAGYLSGHSSHISCSRCHADLALTTQIISKGFTGRHGRAYLVAPSTSALQSTPCSGSNTVASASGGSPSLPNTHTHKPVSRHLVTGMHTVADISCSVCGVVLGWKYVSAEEESQRYKVGKFILETRRCSVGSCWEVDGSGELDDGGVGDWDEEGWCWGDDVLDDERKERRNKRRSSVVRPGSLRPVDELDGAKDWRKDGRIGGGAPLIKEPQVIEEEISFDSQDEDECEDLFAGIWSPALARRRRAIRGSLMR